MLWNWNTIDACFLSETWHIKSSGMFAGSCIGVILLTMSLELLRRAVKEYDRFLIRQHAAKLSSIVPNGTGKAKASSDDGAATSSGAACSSSGGVCDGGIAPFRPGLLQQAIRAFLHMVQFAVAYLIML